MLLSGTVSAQATVTARLDDMAAVERASALITTDLAQALPRISRTESGTLAPAFYADAVIDPHRPALLFVRGGWDHLDGHADRPTIQKRSEERRVGKECVSTCRSRWWPYN